MPTKTTTILRGKSTYVLDFGMDLTGKRKRAYFQTEDEVDDALEVYHKEVKSHGEFWAALKPLERRSTATTLQEIKASGNTLDGVWTDWKRWKKDMPSATVIPMAYDKVVAEWKTRKSDVEKDERYVRDTETQFLKFGEGRLKQNIHEILPGELDAWIKAQTGRNGGPWGMSTKKSVYGRFSGLWEVAIAKGWAILNIVDRLEQIGKINTMPRVYDTDTQMNIMAGVMENEITQSVLAPTALCSFNCMRPEEATHELFGWKYIDLKFGRITVKPEVAKRGDARVIRCQPTGLLWLKLAAKLKNPLPPVNERKIIDEICELIGLDDWIHDGLRKGCATHLRPIYHDDREVVRDMGHTVRTLLENYAALNVPEEVSLEHWKITPAAVEAYRKTDKWKKVLKAAASKRAQRASENESPAG